MFKRIAKAFGKGKKKPRKPEKKLRPGEGILQAAAALPIEGAPPTPTQQAPGSVQPDTQPDVQPAPEPREALIREAMRIRNEKAEALNDLSPRDREKLRKLAEKMLLGETLEEAEGDGRKKNRPPPTRH